MSDNRPAQALDLQTARRLAVTGQLLAGPRPASVLDVFRHLGWIQIDPTRAVARTEHLVLWSRLGAYDLAELDRLLWDDRSLFEYRAYIVPTADLGLHLPTMARFPRSADARAWLAANAEFRAYLLDEFTRRGPLRSRDLEDRAQVAWQSTGWTGGKNLSQMLEFLWRQGVLAIVARDGQQRVYDLAERHLPIDTTPLGPVEEARHLTGTQLRRYGVAGIDRIGWALDGGRPPDWQEALAGLVDEGVAVPVHVEGLAQVSPRARPAPVWYAHRDLLEDAAAPAGPARTTLLSPFDRLIHDRVRTLRLFGFSYKLEIYVPRAQREYGYYVLPILHGERLVGRINPMLDRKAKVLRVDGVWTEPDLPPEVMEGAGAGLAAAIADLAGWLGAIPAVAPDPVPPEWAAALRPLAG
jgi:uncharacterized protein YcaQ